MAVELVEVLAAERLKRQREASEASTNEEVGSVVLGALAERLNESPVPMWVFLSEADRIVIFYGAAGSQREVASWTVDDKMRLVLGDETTEWITSESFSRVIDQAVRLTAKIILDAETTDGDDRKSAEIVELAPRF